MTKIVIVDSDFENQDLERRMVDEAGYDIAVFEDRSADGVIENASDADGIITSYANFPRRVFEALPKLKVISRTGVGFDTIDVNAATEHGVAICTAPGYGTEVVSDHAITLAMSVLRRINELDADIRAGIWNYPQRRPLGQAHGRTFGVVGMGAIGRATARKAAGLGFHVICWSRSLVPGRMTPEGYAIHELEDLLAQSDVVSLHTALVPDTHHLIDARRLALMKDDAVLVNTSRGAVVDTVALAEALCDDRLWGAGIDVFEDEPVPRDHPLLEAPHTVLTPHAAYWSEESGRELRTRTTQSAIDVLAGRRPADCLNPQVFSQDQQGGTR
jgi:D-3-phosphoglycerate dehydrogenase